MRHLRHLLTGCLLLASLLALAQQPNQQNVQTVGNFVAAFNAHDSGAMSRLVADDVQWLSVMGDSVSIETDGKAALVSAMNDYFYEFSGDLIKRVYYFPAETRGDV